MIDPDLTESIKLIALTAKATAEACLKVVSHLQQVEQENQWMSLNEAADRLGSGISPEMLKERCTDGRFKYGLHFINTSDGKRSNYLIRVSAVRKYFETDPAKRPSRRVV